MSAFPTRESTSNDMMQQKSEQVPAAAVNPTLGNADGQLEPCHVPAASAIGQHRTQALQSSQSRASGGRGGPADEPQELDPEDSGSMPLGPDKCEVPSSSKAKDSASNGQDPLPEENGLVSAAANDVADGGAQGGRGTTDADGKASGDGAHAQQGLGVIEGDGTTHADGTQAQQGLTVVDSERAGSVDRAQAQQGLVVSDTNAIASADGAHAEEGHVVSDANTTPSSDGTHADHDLRHLSAASARGELGCDVEQQPRQAGGVRDHREQGDARRDSRVQQQEEEGCDVEPHPSQAGGVRHQSHLEPSVDEDGNSLTQHALQPYAPLHNIVAEQEVDAQEVGHPVAMQTHEGTDASCSALQLPPGCDSPAACMAIAEFAHASGPGVHALEDSEGHGSAFFSTPDSDTSSGVGLAVTSDMSAQHVLDKSPEPILDMSAQHKPDTLTQPTLDSSAQHTLDKTSLPSLDTSAQHVLGTSGLPSLDTSAPQVPASLNKNDSGRSGDYDRPPVAETTPDHLCIGSSPPPAHAPQAFEALAGSPSGPLNTPAEEPLDISANAMAEDPYAFPLNTFAADPLGVPVTTSAEPHGIHVNALARVPLGMPLNAPAEGHLEIPINSVAGDPLEIPANAPAPQLHQACEDRVVCTGSLSGPPPAGVVREGGVPEDDLSATPSLPRGTCEQCTEDIEGPASCASGGSCSTCADASRAPYLQADHVCGVPGDGIGAHVELPPSAKEDRTFVDVPADAKEDRTTVDPPPPVQNVEDEDLHQEACADAESYRGGLARPPLTPIVQECGAPSDGFGDHTVIQVNSPTVTCATCVDLPPPQVPKACEGPDTCGASGPDATVSIEEEDYPVEEEEEYYAQATDSTVAAKSVSVIPVTSTPLQSSVETRESRAQPDDDRACEPGKDGARACRATRELHGHAKAASVEEQVFSFQKEMELRSRAVPVSLDEQAFSKDIQEEQEFQAQPYRLPSMAAVHHVTVPDTSQSSQSSAARTLSGAPTQTHGGFPMVTALHPARHSLPVVSATIGGGSAMALLPGRYAPPTATSSMGDGFVMALLPGRHAAPNPTALLDGGIPAAVHPVRHAHSLVHTLGSSNDFRSLGRDMQSHGTTQAGMHQRSCSLSGVRHQSGTHVGPRGSAAESLHLDSVSLGRLARQWTPGGLPSGAGDGMVTMGTRTAPGPATRWDPHSAAISDSTDVSAHLKYTYPKAIATRSSRLSQGTSCGADALDTWGPADVTHLANGSSRISQGPPCGTIALGTCGPCDATQMGSGSGRMSRASSCGINSVGTCGPCDVTQLGSGSSRMSRASLGGSKGVGACGPCGSKGASIYGQSEVVQKGCASPPPAGNEPRGTIKSWTPMVTPPSQLLKSPGTNKYKQYKQPTAAEVRVAKAKLKEHAEKQELAFSAWLAGKNGSQRSPGKGKERLHPIPAP